MKTYKTQLNWVLSQLYRKGYITRNTALKHYITRLGSIIHTIRNNYDLEIEGKYVKTKNGRDYKYSVIE